MTTMTRSGEALGRLTRMEIISLGGCPEEMLRRGRRS